MSALDDLPAVLTVEEAAALLRIGRSQAYLAVARGAIPSIRVSGRAIRVPTKKLADMLGEAPENSATPAGEPRSSETQTHGDESNGQFTDQHLRAG